MVEGDKKQKFMFDARNFDTDSSKEDEIPPEPTFTESEVEKIKLENIAYGKKIGLEEASKTREEALLASLNHAESLLKELILAEDKREKEKNREVINLSLKIIQKLFPKLLEQNNIDEIENMVLSAIANRQEEARIVITVHEDILDLLKDRIDNISNKAGFQGKIILIANSDMLKSDCRVEWANGGAERNCEAILSVIENILSKQLPTSSVQ